MNRLDGKIALITGAARGIGAAIADRMAAEGATVIRTDLKSSDVVRALDVSNEADWQNCAARIKDEFGQLDILVNNAGAESFRPFQEVSLEEWRKVMAVNVEGPFLGCKVMLPLLAAGGETGEYSSVINISSMLSRLAAAGQTPYSTSKAAIAHFTKCFAMECSALGYRVRANSIHPGTIDTPLGRESFMATDALPGSTIDEKLDFVSQMNPSHIMGEPDDIAWACVYLGSNESRFVNSLELLVDGGTVPAWR